MNLIYQKERPSNDTQGYGISYIRPKNKDIILDSDIINAFSHQIGGDVFNDFMLSKTDWNVWYDVEHGRYRVFLWPVSNELQSKSLE